MPRRSAPGRSHRTPAKHELLNRTVGRTAAVAPYIGATGVVFPDLCAGDGITVGDTDFWHGCSPGILIRHAEHAQRQGLSAFVDLYEINRNTYDSLIQNLTEHTGSPIAISDDRTAFRYNGVGIRATLGSGTDLDISYIRRDKDCVFVNNDPNTIHDWAMRSTLVDEIRQRTWMCTTFSTMGCNVGGLMMKDIHERLMWYGHIQSIKNSLPKHMDLMLAAIDRDAAKWAYLLTAPSKWAGNTEKQTRSSFQKIGCNMRITWWRQSPEAFKYLEDALFLRKTEREEGLW